MICALRLGFTGSGGGGVPVGESTVRRVRWSELRAASSAWRALVAGVVLLMALVWGSIERGRLVNVSMSMMAVSLGCMAVEAGEKGNVGPLRRCGFLGVCGDVGQPRIGNVYTSEYTKVLSIRALWSRVSLSTIHKPWNVYLIRAHYQKAEMPLISWGTAISSVVEGFASFLKVTVAPKIWVV